MSNIRQTKFFWLSCEWFPLLLPSRIVTACAQKYYIFVNISKGTRGILKMKQENLVWLCYEITTYLSSQDFSYNFSSKIDENFSVVRKKKSHTFLLWNKNYIRTFSGNQEIKQCIITISYGYRNSSISKTELFVTTENNWNQLTIVTSSPFWNYLWDLLTLPILSTFL